MEIDTLTLSCLCAGLPLAALKGYPSVAAAQEATSCGRFCGLCVPYIRAILPSHD